MFSVEIDRAKRTIKFRISGSVVIDEMKMIEVQAKAATDLIGGKHLVYADMRGMLPMSPECAEVMGRIIRYGRTHGTDACVHLSDSVVSKLQAARLAREVNPVDKITINVVSDEEGAKVVEEKQAQLRS
jgi:hypothetical protein